MKKSDFRSRSRHLLKGVWVLFLLVVLFGFISSSSAAEKFPIKPVTIIVPFSAGGATDLNARFIAQYLSKHLGQPVLVENRPGAGGIEGTKALTQARPDGHTLVMNGEALLISYYMVPGAPNPKDLEPVAQIPGYPRLLAVSEKTGFKNVQDLIAFAKKDPMKLLVGVNPGSGSHLDTVNMMKAMGIEPNYVPFKGGAERNVALAGGHILATADGMAALRAYIEAKKVIALGVGSPQRMDLYKDIPTLKEQGVDVTSFSWEGFWAPKGTPVEVLQILESAFEKTSKESALAEQLAKNYVSIYYLNREDYSKFLVQEEARKKSLIEALGLAKK